MKNALTNEDYIIHPALLSFVNEEVLPHVELTEDVFWEKFIALIDQFRGENRLLLDKRDELQEQIDSWHKTAGHGTNFNADAYTRFLTEIGYLQDEPADFQINPENIDAEIATTAGPQLVVPLKNARFSLNAANARWGSLYDAYYGTDAMDGSLASGQGYDLERGAKVVSRAKQFLDDTFPLHGGSHRDVKSYLVYFNNLLAIFEDGSTSGLTNSKQFIGHNGSKSEPEAIFLCNNGLHIELQFNPNGKIGASDPCGLDDIQIESALSSIMDCEDAVSAVDAEDKISVYRNWLGLTLGNLKVTFNKGGKLAHRQLSPDKHITHRSGDDMFLPGRSLMLIRNVGIHMYSNLVEHTQDGELPEGLIDAAITAMIASIDLHGNPHFKNSRSGSIYIVKPKMHGPDEVAFSCRVFSAVESMLGLEANTIKIGIMDEERRTSLNLKACIKAARDRVFFINTGFLDRTGDEVHTSMHAGPFAKKANIKSRAWFPAYENNNVDVGLRCGFQGKAQIGKGMWAMPTEMQRMMEEKISHPQAGASTAWVPSPTAATLHALHYHQVNVSETQFKLQNREATRMDMLDIPTMQNPSELDETERLRELENNIQGLLGYVAPWINSGTGCSTILDINDVGLMEDRATLRISCQHISNWLIHGVITKTQILETMSRMAKVVDRQNEGQPGYQPLMLNGEPSLAYQAAEQLIFTGATEANGYTEPVLHAFRIAAKTHPALSAETDNSYQLCATH